MIRICNNCRTSMYRRTGDDVWVCIRCDIFATATCGACGHSVPQHVHGIGQCQYEVPGLNGERRRCTCTFAREPQEAA